MVKRNGATLTEIIIALLVLGAVLGPAVLSMKRQLEGTRWTHERMMAVQLANELLEYYQHLGYQGVQLQLQNGVTPLLPPIPTTGTTANNYLVYDAISGANPQHLFPPINKNPPPNGLNPCLGGPGDVQAGDFANAPDFVNPMPPGTLGSQAEAAFRGHFNFNRRVEIFGGEASLQAAPPFHFQPMPNMGRPLDCYKIRVTISNNTTMRSTGIPNQDPDVYQVVTVLARH